MRRQNPTIRELYRDVAGMGGFCLIGTPAQIVDVMQDWFEGAACDGFNITPTHLPGGCEDFVAMITPELQRAFEANPDAKKNWPTYTASAQRGFLRMVNGAKRPETREKYIKRVIDLVASKVSMSALTEQAMRGNKAR